MGVFTQLAYDVSANVLPRPVWTGPKFSMKHEPRRCCSDISTAARRAQNAQNQQSNRCERGKNWKGRNLLFLELKRSRQCGAAIVVCARTLLLSLDNCSLLPHFCSFLSVVLNLSRSSLREVLESQRTSLLTLHSYGFPLVSLFHEGRVLCQCGIVRWQPNQETHFLVTTGTVHILGFFSRCHKTQNATALPQREIARRPVVEKQPVLQASAAPASAAPADFTQKEGGRGLRPSCPLADMLDFWDKWSRWCRWEAGDVSCRHGAPFTLQTAPLRVVNVALCCWQRGMAHCRKHCIFHSPVVKTTPVELNGECSKFHFHVQNNPQQLSSKKVGVTRCSKNGKCTAIQNQSSERLQHHIQEKLNISL